MFDDVGTAREFHDGQVIFHENGVVLPDREIDFGEIFYRKSDTIVLVIWVSAYSGPKSNSSVLNVMAMTGAAGVATVAPAARA